MATRKKTGESGRRPRTRKKKVTATSAGLSTAEIHAESPPHEITALGREVETDGGAVLSAFREPFAGQWLLFVALPMDQVQPTPYQRDLSRMHVGKLTNVIGRIGRFLDPIILVRAGERSYWTPNGHHRLAAMRELGAKAITALLVPQKAIAYQILSLNTEKAHNLRERALEVVRMYRELAKLDNRPEQEFSLEFEEGALVTLGLCYEGRPRFSGGAYHPLLRRVDLFFDKPLREALSVREKRARRILTLDDVVVEKVEQLKKQGLVSPYLKAFVVARINPLRFRPPESEPLKFDEALDRMEQAAKKFDPSKIHTEDLARAGGPPEETGE
jgi:ParB family chromosome partitioning protein